MTAGLFTVDVLQRFTGPGVMGLAQGLAFLAAGRLLLAEEPPAADPVSPKPYISLNLPLYTGIVSVLCLLYGLNDSMAIVHFSDFLDTYGLNRLSYGAGLLLAGWLADRKRLYLPLAALLAEAMVLVFNALMLEGGWIGLFICANELFGAFVVVFATTLFLDAAKRVGRPALWAVMGRFLLMVAEPLGILLGVWLWTTMPETLFMVVYTGFLLMVAGLFYHGLVRSSLLMTPLPAADGAGEGPGAEADPSDAPAETPLEQKKSSWNLSLGAAAMGRTPAAPQLIGAGEGPGAVLSAAAQPVCEPPPYAVPLPTGRWEEIPQAEEPEEPVMGEAAWGLPLTPEAPDEAAESSSEDRLEEYRERYRLTNRETEVLGEILQGRAIADIAKTLFITARTVKYHIGNLLSKTGTKNQTEMIALLNRKGPEGSGPS